MVKKSKNFLVCVVIQNSWIDAYNERSAFSICVTNKIHRTDNRINAVRIISMSIYMNGMYTIQYHIESCYGPNEQQSEWNVAGAFLYKFSDKLLHVWVDGCLNTKTHTPVISKTICRFVLKTIKHLVSFIGMWYINFSFMSWQWFCWQSQSILMQYEAIFF